MVMIKIHDTVTKVNYFHLVKEEKVAEALSVIKINKDLVVAGIEQDTRGLE